MKQIKNIQNHNIIGFIIIVSLLVMNVILIIQNHSIKVNLREKCNSLSIQIDNIEEKVNEVDKKNELLFTKLQKNIEEKYECQESELLIIQNALASLMNKSDLQFSKTVKMKQTYDVLLAEQKKKTVDISAKDNSLIQLKKTADEYYANKEFLKAYELYKKILLYWSEDTEVRKNKLKSLFYSNRSDNSNYFEILEDIKIIKNSQNLDDECRQIESIIKLEKEGLNE